MIVFDHDLNLCATKIAVGRPMARCLVEVDPLTGLLNFNSTHRWRGAAGQVLARCRLCCKTRKELREQA